MEWGYVALWWLACMAFGVAGFGLLWPLAGKLPDRGWLLGRHGGFLAFAFIVWMLASLGIVPFSQVGCGVVLLALLGAGGYLLYRDKDEVLACLRSQWKVILVGELLFFCVLFGFSYLRATMPEIEGTEKLPDMAFLAGTYHSDSFPPKDPWFSPEGINYFYYGQYCVAAVGKLTGVEPRYGYNLGMALIFAWAAVSAYGVGVALLRNPWTALFAPILGPLLANLDGFVQKVVERSPGFSWWRSSRVIIREEWIDGQWTKVDTTINEFPFWSFVLGDLHAHVLAVPLLLTNLGLLYLALQANLREMTVGQRAGLGALLAIGLGATPATNYWELPTMAVLMGGVAFLRVYKGWNGGKGWQRLLAWEAAAFGVVGAGSFLAYLPFHLNFARTQSDGFRFVPWEMQTSIEHFLIIYTVPVFLSLSFLVLVANDSLKSEQSRDIAGCLVGACGLVALATNSVPIGVSVLCVAGMTALAFSLPFNRQGLYGLFLGACGFGLFLVAEYVYIEDWYGGDLERMNTVFKFHYQAWTLLGVATAYFAGMLMERAVGEARSWSGSWLPLLGGMTVALITAMVLYARPVALSEYRLSFIVGSLLIFVAFAARLYVIGQGPWLLRGAWVPALSLLLAGSFLFHVYGPVSRNGNFRRNPPTLDGMVHLQTKYPGDYEAMMFLAENADPDDVILEAAGEAFSNYGRFAAFLGRAAPMGWGHHQSLWRDRSGQLVDSREQAVKRAYESPEPQAARQLIDDYGVDYIVVGHYERKRHMGPGLEKFRTMPNVRTAFESAATTVYEVQQSP